MVLAGMSISLDGYVAGPHAGPENPGGDGGERLHEWLFQQRSFRRAHGLEGGETGAADSLFSRVFDPMGAFVLGRRMFDEGERDWSDDAPFRRPVFVLTHRPREPLVTEDGTTFTFVEGVERALEQAREAAGGKDVGVGGAETVRQFLAAGHLDVLDLQVVPVVLGGGVSLFDGLAADAVRLELAEAVEAAGVAHLRFRVSK